MRRTKQSIFLKKKFTLGLKRQVCEFYYSILNNSIKKEFFFKRYYY